MNSSFSHVALLLPSVEASAAFLRAQGIETEAPEAFDSEGTKEIYVGSYAKQSGLLLLLEPISPGPYERAMTKRGPSLHHIAIDVHDVEGFSLMAQKQGWKLHAASEKTMAYQTVWLFLKGVPTLIEVHQKKELSSKPKKVSKIEIPIQEEQVELFEAIGLGGLISRTAELHLTIDGRRLSFAEINRTK